MHCFKIMIGLMEGKREIESRRCYDDFKEEYVLDSSHFE
jgi:hypothetical protein